MKKNLALTKEKEVIAYYKVPSMTVTIIDDEKKKKTKSTVGQVLRKLLPNKNFELALVPKSFRLLEKVRETSRTLTPEAKEIGIAHLNHTMDYLNKEMELPYEYQWVVGVWLKKEAVTLDVKQLVEDKLSEMSEKVMNTLGYEVELNESWYDDFEHEENEMLQTLGALRPIRLSDEELFYHQRYQFLRYTQHEQDEVCANRDILNVTDTIINVKNGDLEFVTPYGKSYVSILPIGKSPTLLNEQHIAERIARFNFPVELRIKAEFAEVEGSTGVKGVMGRSKVRTRNIVGETKRSGGAQQDKIIEGGMALNDLEKQLGNKEPIIHYSMFFVVAGSSQAQLKARKKSVLSAFEPKIKVSRATFDQPYLFQNILYGKKLGVVAKRWKHTATARGIAEQLLFTTTYSGTSTGFYLGRVDNNMGKWENVAVATHASRIITMYNPTIANKEGIAGKITKNPHIEITGETGGGKSVLAQIIFLQQSFTQTKLLYVDPKSALRKQYEKKCKDDEFRAKNPLLVKHLESFNYVTLDHRNKKNKGVLDPIVILESDDAIEVSKSMIDYLGKDKWEMEQETEISKEIKKVVAQRSDGEKVGFMHVIENLQKHDDKLIRVVGDYLYEKVEGSILELAFSDGSVQGLNYNERVTILEVANLSLPDKNKNDKITDHQRNSIVLMMALGSFCKRFGEMNPSEDTMEFFDEAWVLRKSAEGQAVIMSIRRVGRSMNNILVLITQSVNDNADDDDTTGFGTTFAFKEPNEMEDILKHMRLQVNEKNLEWLENMTSGQCLFRDVFGNVNRISIDVFDKAWLELFSPVEETVASEIENKFARSG